MASVLNQDIPGIHSRINRFLIEIIKSASSNVSEMSSFDQARCMTYLTAVDEYLNWMAAQPELDLPETAPKEHVLEANPEIVNVENESCNDLVRQLETGRDEVVNSQSARMPSGILKFDQDRLTACISKARAFMTDYVAKVTPLDMPESSPAEPVSGHGRRGIGSS